MPTRAALLLSCLLALAPAGTARPADEAVIVGPVGRRAHAWVSSVVPHGFSGAVLLAREGRTLLLAAYGEADRTRHVPARTDTLWPIGSISKHFTAAAVMLLVQRGELALDDTLGDLLDDVPAPYAAISLHQLLSHQAGWPESSLAGEPPDSAAACLAHAFRTGLDFEPGTGLGYSNLGYGVLAALVETVAGQPFEAFLREQLLVPAGMVDTAIRALDWDDGRVARGMIDGRDRGRLDAGLGEAPWWLLGAGGVQTTVADMAAWTAALSSGAPLSAASVATMTSVQAPFGDGAGMGYGCGVFPTPRGTTIIGHNGSDDVFSADWKHDLDEDLTLFVAANHADVYADVISDAVWRIALGDDPAPAPAVVVLPAEQLAERAGRWELEGGGRVTTVVRGDGLLVSSDDARGAGLVHPVPAGLEERRQGLLLLTRVAFQEALDGDFERLHLVLDRHAPASVFAEEHAGMLAGWADELGPLEALDTIPGRNRFGEIAVVVVFDHARGRRLVEYSFGEDDVGSVRLLPDVPARLVQPTGPGACVAWDPAEGRAWTLDFELDGDGRPAALLLRDVDGAVVRGLPVD